MLGQPSADVSRPLVGGREPSPSRRPAIILIYICPIRQRDRKSQKKIKKARKVIDLLPKKAYLVSVERDRLSGQGGHPAHKAYKRKVEKDKKSC